MIAIKLWRIVVIVCAVFAAQTPPSYAASSLDPLSTPSRMSIKAQTALITSVAKAGSRLVAVGERGTILLSDDQGKSWRQVQAPVRVTLTKVTFATKQQGWAIGYSGVVLITRDGGENWTKQLDGIEAAQIEERAAKSELNPDEGRLRGASYLIKDGADKPFLDIRFVDEENGMIVGAYGLAFVTHDAGQTWQSIMGEIENPEGMHLYAIHQAPSGLYLVGERGHILRAEDMSGPFIALSQPGEGTLFGMVSSISGELIVYGLRGHVYRSVDAGATWDKLVMPPVNFTTGLSLADGTLILGDESGQVIFSHDMGVSFHPVALEQLRPLTDIIDISKDEFITAGIGGLVQVHLQSSKKVSQ